MEQSEREKGKGKSAQTACGRNAIINHLPLLLNKSKSLSSSLNKKQNEMKEKRERERERKKN